MRGDISCSWQIFPLQRLFTYLRYMGSSCARRACVGSIEGATLSSDDSPLKPSSRHSEGELPILEQKVVPPTRYYTFLYGVKSDKTPFIAVGLSVAGKWIVSWSGPGRTVGTWPRRFDSLDEAVAYVKSKGHDQILVRWT